MARYVIELASCMSHVIEAEKFDAGATGMIFSAAGGDVVAVFPHGSTIIRQDAIAKPSVDEIEAAEQRGFERGRATGSYRGERVGTLAGATVPAADDDLEPGAGPIQPPTPIHAYEETIDRDCCSL